MPAADLTKAYRQAGAYFDALPEQERPRYILVSDFQTFELHDLDERGNLVFSPWPTCPTMSKSSVFILGIQKADLQGSGTRSTFRRPNSWATCTTRSNSPATPVTTSNAFSSRTVFCLFADDTGIFEPRDIFLDFLETRTREDSSDLGLWLSRLFQVLDTPEDSRQKALDEDLARFPYVNGGPSSVARCAFPTLMPPCGRHCSTPAGSTGPLSLRPFFGALFPIGHGNLRNAALRARTTPPSRNILKVIEPLFSG